MNLRPYLSLKEANVTIAEHVATIEDLTHLLQGERAARENVELQLQRHIVAKRAIKIAIRHLEKPSPQGLAGESG